MFIHIWMHWFWITAAYYEGFLFFTAHSVSLHPHFAEAGLLDNETFSPLTPHPYNDSSQTDLPKGPNITSPIVPPADTTPHPPPSPSPSPSPSSSSSSVFSSPQVNVTTEEPTATAKTPLPPSSDVADTHNGATIDGYSIQLPIKKSTKYSKYGKVKMKGKEEKGGTDKDGEEYTTDAITTTAIAKGGQNLQNEGNGTTSPTPPADEDADATEDILKNETLVIESKVEEGGGYTAETFAPRNGVAAATSAQNFEGDSALNAGSITGITLAILVVFSLFGAVSFVLYRRRYLNKPEVLHDKCSNLDSSGYIDETSLRENSEEMYSLDNDSFLNSLEAMTIQNYWTENVKHTKL